MSHNVLRYRSHLQILEFCSSTMANHDEIGVVLLGPSYDLVRGMADNDAGLDFSTVAVCGIHDLAQR